uniref:Coatomer WD associated region domain-containing protein n=1 Tax=Setaria italica TaxID=4555 RepID=K3XZE2_SETIT
MAVKNFKGSKTYILSKIKSFKAHERGSVLLEVHPSRPYVLSSLAHANLPHGNARVVCSIKLWDWERGWDCVQTFNTEDFPRQLKFNPNDQDTFVTFFETKGAEIWDYDTGTLVETLKEKNISTACSHPELPVLITGSMNGRVSLWSSSTFNLVGVLNCDLGTVYNVFGVKGSERIIIGHAHGIAVVEIGHMLESERPHESEGSEI